MNKLVLLPLLFFIGCESVPPKIIIKTEYQEVIVPVSNVPTPPDTYCPPDALETITRADLQKDGELARAYKIAVLQLRDCSTLREKVITKYRELAKEDADKISNLDDATSSPFGSSGPVVAPDFIDDSVNESQQWLEDIFDEFNSAMNEARNKLKADIINKYIKGGSTTQPQPSTPESFEYPAADLLRELNERNSGSSSNPFDGVGNEFSDLTRKRYDVEE